MFVRLLVSSSTTNAKITFKYTEKQIRKESKSYTTKIQTRKKAVNGGIEEQTRYETYER